MKKIPFLIFIAFFAVSCAPKYTPPDYSGYVWPPPPEKPRIRLLEVIRTDQDIRTPSTVELLLGGELSFGFRKPHGIAVDKRNNIYVSDSASAEVYIINIEKGSIKKFFNPYGYTLPLGIDYDYELDWLAVVDAGKSSVYIHDLAKGKLIFTLGQKRELSRPVAAAFDPERQRIYVADTRLHKIVVFDLQGNHLFNIGSKGYGQGNFLNPTGIAVDDKGQLIIVNSFNFRFDILDSEGNFIKSIGKHGDRIGMFARPKSVAMDSLGHIYITDAAFNNFQIFDYDGHVYLFVGVGGVMPGSFANVYSIFIDHNDKIYVTDQTNRRIQIFQFIKYPDDDELPVKVEKPK